MEIKRKYRKEFDEYMTDEQYYLTLNQEGTPGKSINEIVFNLRKEYGYTQEEVAKQLNIKQNTLSRYEQGQRQIPFEMLMDILHFYGLTLNIVTLKEDDEEAKRKYFSAMMKE